MTNKLIEDDRIKETEIGDWIPKDNIRKTIDMCNRAEIQVGNWKKPMATICTKMCT